MTEQCWRCQAKITESNRASVGFACGNNTSSIIYTCTDCDPAPICPKLGDAIKTGFRHKKMGMGDVADYLNVSVTRVSAILRGRAIPGDEELAKIAAKIEVTEESLRKLLD